MKFAISNIAWNNNEDDEIFSILKDNDITAIEVAPTKIFEIPFKTPDNVIYEYVEFMRNKGFNIIGMQALLLDRKSVV